MLRWDIFCRVIDNFGDVGICWRLASDLAARGRHVRLWLDDARALGWMAPGGCAGVEPRAWTDSMDFAGVAAPEVLIEAFGCTVPDEMVAIFSKATKDRGVGENGTFHAWINLEYLSAEPFAQCAHRLPSPVSSGPGAGLVKHFFYPGFTRGTGGLIREPDLLARHARFDRTAWLGRFGVDARARERLISLFCYEPAALGGLLEQFERDAAPTRLLVTAGRAQAAVRALIGDDASRGALSITHLPLLAQCDYDHLLWACHLNFVRGEDSLARALWAGRPFVWQLYPQHDGAHVAKLGAFLDWLAPPSSLAHLHRGWNSSGDATLPALDLPGWQAAVHSARARLLAQEDLTTQLLRFVAGEKR